MFSPHFSGTLVQFSNKFGGTIQHDVDDRSNRVFDGRYKQRK